MNINLIAVGKLKDSWQREACAEYLKRLSAFAKVTVYETDPTALPQKPSPTEIEKALLRESSEILKYARGVKAALCIEGKLFDSEKLARKLETLGVGGASDISFIIGSSFGLSDSLKSQCELKISMSPMTFPHGLARVMLLEQLYRAFSIINNMKYHK